MRITRVLTATMGLVLVASGGISSVAIAAPSSVTPQRADSGAPRVDRGVGNGLGNGLGRLLAEKSVGGVKTNGRAAAGLFDQSKLAVTDSSGRVLVQLTPQANQDRAAFRAAAERVGLKVVATEEKLGTLEGFVALGSVKALDALPGRGTLAMASKPRSSVGKVTSQGFAFQRASFVPAGITGARVTVGALSDSYNTATKNIDGTAITTRASTDVRTGDLPGPANPVASRRTPVVVVNGDLPAARNGDDEGRGMLQIVHDLAPRAKLCFATAFTGQVSFANNIRALADTTKTCGADVIVDDVAYLDEPFFSEGIIGDAIDDVAAQGVSYFSAAGNDGDRNAWRSAVNLVEPVSGKVGSNIKLAGVDPDLYSGGFQDFNPSPAAVDIAQNLTIDQGGGTFNLQWSDPTDLNGSTLGDPIDTQTGTLGATPLTLTYTPAAGDVGKAVQFKVDDAVASGGADLILTVTKPNGSTLGPIDTGNSPETAATTLVAGTYTITVEGFQGATGSVVSTVSPVIAASKVTTDFNALFFNAAGQFVGALSDINQISGRPIELTTLNGPDARGLAKLQLVIAKSGTAPTSVKEIGYINGGGIYTTEYWNPLAPAIFGHPAADGATAVAATDPFRPYLPESFTSPGGQQKVYFDSAGNAFAAPKVRQVPQIASTDGGNTTFFGRDSERDSDRFANFFGTSAAAPHAAGIAALMLDKAGSHRSISPRVLRAKMQASAFAHDLDPNVSQGRAGGLTITARGAQGSEAASDPGSMADPRFFTISYTGAANIRKITFFGETASPTALKDRRIGGIVFDPRPLGTAPFTNKGFPFTVGAATGGLSRRSVSASYTLPVPATRRQKSYRRMTITFAGNGLNAGEGLQFGIDRDLYVPATGYYPDSGNGADELGGAVEMPRGSVITNGMKFVVTRTNGTTFTGYFRNRIGKAWSPLDGFGVVDAQAATR